MHHIEIDKDSGFCFGVTTAISKAEEELAKGAPLYCLGDIVHNGQECERLKEMGLITINHEEFARLKNVKVLLRAHGEPPETYELARKNHIEIIDATCPVVLRLQKRIKQEYDTTPHDKDRQIVIYGKNGHAEVLGLVGQTEGKAIVIEKLEEAQTEIADFMEEKPDETMQIVADELDLDTDAVKSMYDLYDFSTEITDDDKEGFQKTADFMYESGMIDEAFDVKQLFIEK